MRECVRVCVSECVRVCVCVCARWRGHVGVFCAGALCLKYTCMEPCAELVLAGQARHSAAPVATPEYCKGERAHRTTDVRRESNGCADNQHWIAHACFHEIKRGCTAHNGAAAQRPYSHQIRENTTGQGTCSVYNMNVIDAVNIHTDHDISP